LVELKEQTRSAYRPDVVLIGCDSLSLYHHDALRGNIPFKWAQKTLNETETKLLLEKKSQSNLALDFHNVGLGSANHVEASWTFDRNYYLDKISLKKDSFPRNLEYIEVEGIDDLFTVENTLYKVGSSEYSKDAILPVNIDSQPHTMFIPIDYTILWSTLFYQITSDYDSDQTQPLVNQIQEMPSISLEFRFVDVGGNQHSKHYMITIVPQSVNLSEERVNFSRDCIMSGRIVVQDKAFTNPSRLFKDSIFFISSEEEVLLF